MPELLVRRAPEIAVRLLGAQVAAGGVTIRLTEVEAYAGDGQDPSSHAHRGPTRRNAAMFGPPGQAYVYFTYGMHWCLNVVCSPPGHASAVLLRAGEVVSGLETARSRRPRSSDRDLARGPARLTRALAVNRAAGDTSMLDGSGPLELTLGPPAPADRVRAGPRVGVTTDTAWRFWLADEPTVSAFRKHTRRNRLRPAAPSAGESPS
ncbi:MAG: DNA-3-methyladenine glycosylase [Micromonosporaceae bacterium]